MSIFVYPTLVYEIVNFPEANKYSEWVKRNKLVIIIGLITIDIVYAAIIYEVSPFQVSLFYVEGEKNFKICNLKSKGYLLVFIITYIYKLIILFFVAILTFMEYNLINIRNEIKTITVLLYFNIIFNIILTVINIINPKRFFFQYHLKMIIVCTFTLVNYIGIIWIRMYYEKNKQNHTYGVKIVNHKKSISTKLNSSVKENVSIFSKFINYHYRYTNTLHESENESNTSTIPEIQIYTSIIDSKQMTDIVGLNQ